MKQTWLTIDKKTRAQLARFFRLFIFTAMPALLLWLVSIVKEMRGWYAVPLGVITGALELSWRVVFPATPDQKE